MDIEVLAPFGVAVHGVDPTGVHAHVDVLAGLLRGHGLVVLRGASLDADAQIALVRAVGPLLDESGTGALHSHIRHEPGATPYAAGLFEGPLAFHSDLTYTSAPHEVLSLQALELPPAGGETRFASGALAFAALDPATRAAIAGRVARHVYRAGLDAHATTYRGADLGTRHFAAEHPVVRRNPRTGRDALFVNELLTDAIVGMPRAGSDRLLDALFAVLYDPSRVLVHRWDVGDLVLWENLEVQHARGDFDRTHRRVLRRVIAGDASMHVRHNEEFAAQRTGVPGIGPVLV